MDSHLDPSPEEGTRISFDIPRDLAAELTNHWGDLNTAAREAFVIESYRAGKISLGKLAELLGLETSYRAQQWLSTKSIPLNYTVADLESDCATLDRLLGDETS